MVLKNDIFAKSESPRPLIPLLVGQGKLARHLSHYLSLLQIESPHSSDTPPAKFETWSNARDLDHEEFRQKLSFVNCVWILVADRAISEVSEKIGSIAPSLPQLHSSAATYVPGVISAHPLQTFGPDVYSDESAYRNFPFMFVKEEWESNAASFIRGAFPLVFRNPSFKLAQSERALYHAYCVMMANFPQLLWARTEKESASLLPDPEKLFAPILKQAAENFLKYGPGAVTGPMVRGDFATIKAHETALNSKPELKTLYQIFVQTFRPNA